MVGAGEGEPGSIPPGKPGISLENSEKPFRFSKMLSWPFLSLEKMNIFPVKPEISSRESLEVAPLFSITPAYAVFVRLENIWNRN
jgi:hypothetical protein